MSAGHSIPSPIRLDAAHGGRVAQMTVGQYDLLFDPGGDPDPTSWGAYPMVPWAGRIDSGHFTFDGVAYEVPINFGEHAMHGTAFTSVWTQLSDNHLGLEMDDRWPFGGTVSHRVEGADDGQTGHFLLELSVMAGATRMPAMVGWHPWFLRQLTPQGPPAELTFTDYESAEMYELDDRMMPTGKLLSPPPAPPWDNPFRSVVEPLTLTWPGQLQLQLRSSCDHWVIYDHPEHAVCVEPQSGPPNIFNSDRMDREPDILEAGESLTRSFTIEWTLL